MASILVLNGPNLNLLGSREPDIYGSDTLDDINIRLGTACIEAGHTFDSFQSNSEGALIDRIHLARSAKIDYMLVNFGGYTHTSVALRDAYACLRNPFYRGAPIEPVPPRRVPAALLFLRYRRWLRDRAGCSRL